MAKHNVRSSNYFCQFSYYYYTHDAAGNIVNQATEEDWKNLWRNYFKQLIATGQFNYIVWIFHYADKDKDGNPKGLHIHFILNYKKGVEHSVVMNMLNATRSSDVQIIGKKDGNGDLDKSGAFQYLLHITQEALKAKKHIYDFSEVEWIADDMKKYNVDWLMKQFYPPRTQKKDEKEVLDEIYLNLLKGEYTIAEARQAIINKFGASKWTTAKRQADMMVLDWMQMVNDWYATHNSCKVSIFISGGGGSQKTDLAQNVIGPHFADKRGCHVPPAPMGRVTYDPIGTYRGQKVSILNELTGDAWILEGFCEVFDPTHSSTAGSRFADKPFFPDVICMTTSDSLEEFIAKMFIKWFQSRGKGTVEIFGEGANQSIKVYNSGQERNYSYSTLSSSFWNKVWQVRRRIPIVLELNNGVASIYLLDYSKEFYYVYDYSHSAYLHFADVQYSLTDETVKANFLKTLEDAITKYYEMNNFTVTPGTVQKPVINL